MSGKATVGLEPMGLGVGRCIIRASDPSAISMLYYCDSQAAHGDHQSRQLTLRSRNGPIGVPGTHTLVVEGGEAGEDPFELEIAANEGAGRELRISRAGKPVAQGRGFTDPDDPEAILVSWWSGEVKPYGTVKYTIRDANQITGKYISETTTLVPGDDTIEGDTTDGWPGSYVLHTLGPDGRRWGPHIWDLTGRGDIIDLCWTEEGRIICRGFGIVYPDDPDCLVVAYIAV